MLGSHKKKNPAPEVLKDEGGRQQAMIPREMPPLRTFIVRSFGEQGLVERQVDAHGVGFDEERMVAFTVFFFLDPDTKLQPAQATKLVLNSNEWSEVEEINPLFPTLKGN